MEPWSDEGNMSALGDTSSQGRSFAFLRRMEAGKCQIFKTASEGLWNTIRHVLFNVCLIWKASLRLLIITKAWNEAHVFLCWQFGSFFLYFWLLQLLVCFVVCMFSAQILVFLLFHSFALCLLSSSSSFSSSSAPSSMFIVASCQ